ncbi:MAG: hypothetical protein HAW63_03110 [Bdellovibrionaceae bacterium]|nr:hypothetical protein [Pseudobdellovibrionaceae bacterium]
MYNVDKKHLKKPSLFKAIANNGIDFVLLTPDKNLTSLKKRSLNFYRDQTLFIPFSQTQKITSVVDLNQIWSDKFHYNKLHIFWTLLTYPFAPETAFLYLLQHSNSISKQSSFLKSKFATLASFNIKSNNFLSRFQIPSYSQVFHLVKNYVLTTSELTGKTNKDTKTLNQAIKNAQSFVGFDFLGTTKNFCSFLQIKKSKKTIIKPIGGKASLSGAKNISLYIHLPEKPKFPYQVKIYKNQKLFLTYSKLEAYIPISQKGVYKILVELMPPLPRPFRTYWTPWIISNPFFIN